MRQFFANVGALLVAGVSFALTIGFVLGLQQLVGLNLFSFMWWFVIPLGAFVTGLLAASGYYVGAVKLNVKPTRVVAIGTMVIAALVQGVLYFSQYAMAKTEDGQPISNFVDFPRFIGWTLTHAKYGLIVYGYQPGGADGGMEAGFLGYVVAVLQFLALVAGGLVVYAVLADKPYCDGCSKFLKQVFKFQHPFAGDTGVITDLRTVEPLSNTYFNRLRDLPTGGTSALELELARCPGCAREALIERPMFVKDGKLAYQGDSYRTTWTPKGQTVETELSSLRPAPSETHVVAGP